MKSFFPSQTCHVALVIYVHRNQSPPNRFIGEMIPLLRHSCHVALAIYVHRNPSPPNWFIGFKDVSLQLLVKEKGIGSFKPSISYKGVVIEKVHTARSKNYLFIDLKIDKRTDPGKFDIIFTSENGDIKGHFYGKQGKSVFFCRTYKGPRSHLYFIS